MLIADLIWSCFNAHLSDDEDILARRNSFIEQANGFFCNFPMLYVETKNTSFKVYFNSHYGSELWNRTNNKLQDYCIAWRKSLYEDFGRFHTIQASQVLL